MCPGNSIVGGFTSATLLVILSLQCGLAQTAPNRSHSVPGAGPCLSASGSWIEPSCLHRHTSDFSFFPPFPDINPRSCSIHLLSTHPPAFKDFFLPTQTHTHLLLSSLLPFLMTLLNTSCLFLAPKSMILDPYPPLPRPATTAQGQESPTQKPAVGGGGEDQ